jgi:hypothetical protein
MRSGAFDGQIVKSHIRYYYHDSHLWASKNHYFCHQTTHIFQILDIALLDALKKYATGLETLDEESRAVAFFLKVYCDFKQTMVEINI